MQLKTQISPLASCGRGCGQRDTSPGQGSGPDVTTGNGPKPHPLRGSVGVVGWGASLLQAQTTTITTAMIAIRRSDFRGTEKCRWHITASPAHHIMEFERELKTSTSWQQSRNVRRPEYTRTGVRRFLLHHVPLALASAGLLALFMTAPTFDVSTYRHADVVSGRFPRVRSEDASAGRAGVHGAESITSANGRHDGSSD